VLKIGILPLNPFTFVVLVEQFPTRRKFSDRLKFRGWRKIIPIYFSEKSL